MASMIHRGLCCEEEDFVKSFLPSLFDSDSDTDETFLSLDNGLSGVRSNLSEKALQVHLGRPMQKTTSSEAFSKVQSYNKRALGDMELTIKEEVLEATSPSSQGISNASTQTPFSGGLEHSESLDSTSPFYSVLSFESTDTDILEDFSPTCFAEEHSPAKRQKIDGSVMLRQSPISVSCTNSTTNFGGLRDASPASSIVSAQSAPSPVRLAPALMPRHSLPVHQHPAVPFSTGGITTGIPVDSYPSDLARPWVPPQAMIPTNPPAPTYAAHFGGNHIPSNLPAPVTSTEKIAAALLDVKKTPLAAPPLGLKLDLLSVATGLRALGMAIKE